MFVALHRTSSVRRGGTMRQVARSRSDVLKTYFPAALQLPQLVTIHKVRKTRPIQISLDFTDSNA